MQISITTVQYLIQGLFPCFLSAVFLLALIATDNTFAPKIYHSFVAATVSGIILSICEGIDYYLQMARGSVKVRLFLAAMSFTCRIACIGFTASISLRNEYIQKIHIFCLIALNGIVSFISIPTGFVFRCSPDHVWSYGIGMGLPYVLTLMFVLILLFSGFNRFYSNRIEAITVLLIIMICVPANILELGPKLKLLLSSTLLIGVDLYFLCLNVEVYRRDAMTDVYNRRSFYMDAKRNSNHKMTVISMDLNNLKVLNDVGGHTAGDTALCEIAKIMNKAFEKRGVVYRVGGDEFMIIIRDKYSLKVPSLLERFDYLLSRTQYVVSYGCETYYPGDNFDFVVQKADEAMYKMKKQLKGGNVR